MTNREKNLVRNFLSLTGLDKETTVKEDKAIIKLGELIDLLPKEHKKEGIRLQSDLLEIFDLIKWVYMDYGEKLSQVVEEYDLDWTPKVAEEITREANEENNKTKVA